MIKICVFGDSISEGYYDSKNGGWVNLLARKFKSPSLDYEVHNFSVSGFSSSEVLKIFDLQSNFVEPDIVVFMLGANDSCLLKDKIENVSLSQFNKNMVKLVKKAKKLNVRVVLISDLKVNEKFTKPVVWDKHCYYYNSQIEKYNKITEHVAKQNDCLFIDVYGLLDKTDLFDGVHPNTNGHKKLFENIHKKIKQLM